MSDNAIRLPLWSGMRGSELMAALSQPPDRYRPVPWLAWTGGLEWPGLERQLREMLDKGITEFFLFPIYGMELPYMSSAYWERVGQTLEFCSANGMKCWIYDEYNWPSGVCAGAVLRDHPEHCEKHLWIQAGNQRSDLPSGAIETHENGDLTWAVVPIRGVMINTRGCDWLSPVPGYLDVLSPAGNRAFIESTHERYDEHFGDEFAKAVPGFFTDEPGMHALPVKGWAKFPYTDDLFAGFEERYGYDLRGCLADLAADRPNSPRTRCHFWGWVAERFGGASAKQQREWCDQRGLALTGHCLAEETLAGQVRTNGDLWEFLRHFTIPGIDMLANADGFNFPYRVGFYSVKERRGFHLTCKLVHGIVRHSGGREMMSEAFGVCDWGMNLFRQKCGFHYQLALGVTLFNDNSLITSIADFRKWAIAGKHFTQPWWQHYREYADYNARLAAIHAEGNPVAEIAVLHPRSTMWARCGADNDALEPLQTQLYDLLDELIRGQWHFDFIFEPILAEAQVEDGELVTEHACYRALVVPSATDLPEACLAALERFAAAGGVLILCGELPTREVESQADVSDRTVQMLEGRKTSAVAASGKAVCQALAPHVTRALVLTGEGAREFVSSHRRLAGSDVLFVANMAERCADVSLSVGVGGPIVVCDPVSLECYRPAMADGSVFAWHFEPWQAFLVFGGASDVCAGALPRQLPWLAPKRVQVLDGDWDFAIEPGNMLRLDVEVRPDPENAGVPEGWFRGCDPDGWIKPEDGRRLPEPLHPHESPWYWMRSVVRCRRGAQPRYIVCDSPDFLEVYVNGTPTRQVQHDPLWTEENICFDVVGLFTEGDNMVHIRARTSKYSDPKIGAFAVSARLLQPVVLVGDFLVDTGGFLVSWQGRLRVDQPWEEQGLPHAAGVGVYRRVACWDGNGQLFLHLPECHDAVEVFANGQSCGVRTWPPYVVELTPYLVKGDNAIEVRLRNTLGNIITETYGGNAPDQPPTSGLLAAPRLLTV